MNLATPELFADGTCGRQLPAGELLQEFRFGQFCPLKVLDGGNEATIVVGDDRREGGNDSGKPANLGAGGSPLDGRDRLSLGELLQVESVTIARSSVGVAAGPVALALPSGGLSAPAQPNGNSNGGPNGDPTIYVVRSVYDTELEAFIAAPSANLATGNEITFPISAAQAQRLRRSLEAKIVFENYDITIHVRKAPPPPPPSGDTGTVSGAPTGGGIATVDPTILVGTKATVTGKKEDPVYAPSRLLKASDFQGVVLALYFEWKQSWMLKGFSRGRLLQSLALAPQEETTIELFTWDRKKTTLEQASSFESEQTFEDEQKTQDTTEVFHEMTSKHEFELKVGGSLDVQYNPGPVKIKLQADASARDKTDADRVCRDTQKAIREAVHKSTSRVKVQRSSKVTETKETGSEERITRKVRNPNLCHTLNLDYFEILTHYTITTAFNEDGMRFCAMIPNPVSQTKFERLFMREHEGALRDALLDRSLASGFEALRLLRARKLAKLEIDARRAEREAEPLADAPKDQPAQAGISDEESAANGYLATLQATARKLMDDRLAAMLDTVFTCLDGDVAALGTKKGQVPAQHLDAGKRWLAQQLLLRSFSSLTLLLGELASAPDSPKIREWGPRLAAVMPDATCSPKPSQLNLEPQEVKEGVLSPAMESPNGPHHVHQVWDWGWWWGEIKRIGLFDADDGGVGAQIERFSKVYTAFLDAAKGQANQSEQQQLLAQQQAGQDRQSDDDRLENDFPIRDYALAEERAEVLERHLQEHAEHYSFALFLALPPQEQLQHIERAMAGIATGFEPGFFQPRVVSQIGNLLLVPLNHEVIDKAEALLDTLKARIDVPTEVDTVLLPSPGLTIDARLGHCSACEDFIEQTRTLDIDLRKAQLRQAQAEADRLEKRVSAAQLDDPKSQVPRLAVELPQQTGPRP